MKIPSWLAPLSHNSEPSVAELPASNSVSTDSLLETPASEGSSDIFATESSERSRAAVFGGQLLGESSADGAPITSSGSKKGLFLGLAAAAVLVVGGLWYFRQSPSRTSSAVASVQPVSAPSSASAVPASNSSATHTVTPVPPPTPAPVSPQLVKNSEHISSTPVSSAPSERRVSNPPAPQTVAEPEPEEESPLGEVHLGAPVVNRGRGSQQSAEALPSIDSSATNPAGEAFSALAPPDHKQPTAPLPVGGDVTPVQLIKSVPPVYPQLAKMQRISGNVQIDALIDASGNVANSKVISGPAILHQAALEAVKQWKYKPATLDGQPTSVHLTITVQFRNQ